MADHALLVPVGLEALVVNRTDKYSTIWSLGHKQYGSISKLEPLEPPPFIRGNDWPRVGVTLSWALPDALTRGRETDGRLAFPYIPNRWLIVRTLVACDGNPRPAGDRLKAWLVESDYLGPEGSNLYPDPGTPERDVTRIGRCWEIGDWDAAREGETPHLTAVGPGDMTFTAYLANIDNVLTFHDSLDLDSTGGGGLGLGDEETATLSYLVAGWYALPTEAPEGWSNPDPLAFGPDTWQTEEGWKTLMERFKWSVGGDHDLEEAIKAAVGAKKARPEDNYPARTLCHGQIYGVNWSGLYGPAQTGPLTRQNLADFRDPEKRASLEDPQKRDSQEPQPAELPHVAFGNSAIDCLASLMEYLLGLDDQEVDISTLIQALHYGLVTSYDEPGGQVELEQRIHNEWFATRPGGTQWELVSQTDGAEPGGKDAPEILAGLLTAARTELEEAEQALANLESADPERLETELVAAQAAVEVAATRFDEIASKIASISGKLGALNGSRQALDKAERDLASSQEELYAIWWKCERLGHLADGNVGVERPELEGRLLDLMRQIRREQRALERALERGKDELKEAEQFLAEILKGTPLALRRSSAPRFYEPVDPVALIYGFRRSTRHGEDGRFTPDGSLFVRFSGDSESGALGQAIRSLDMEAGSLTSETLLDELEEAADIGEIRGKDLIPAAVLDLILEATLLDPTQSDFLAGLIEGASGGEIRTRQQMIWRDYAHLGVSTAHLTRAAGFDGVRPSPVAVEKWSPPWAPIFLCWRVSWYPGVGDPDNGNAEELFSGLLEQWDFNGLDYDWSGTHASTYEDVLTLQGRTLLTKTSTAALEENLERLFQRYGEGLDAAEMESFERIKQKLRSADLLSQPLIGFHDRLVMRDPAQFYDPDDEILQGLLGSVRRAAPLPDKFESADSHFYPIRAGHFRLQRLWVVDAYGQVFDPIYERGQTPASFTPIRGSGMATVGRKQRTDTQMVQLPPRIVQPARLNFRFMSGGEENPVCGWLLPNHFDNTIAVYDAAGAALGEIGLAAAEQTSEVSETSEVSRRKVRWEEAARQSAPLELPPSWLGAFGPDEEKATTEDVTPEVMTDIVTTAPKLLTHLEPAMWLALQPAVVALALPAVEGDLEASLATQLQNLRQLEGLVSGLLNHKSPADAFDDLIKTIDATLWTTDPLGQRQDNTSTLIGRPLALVRARLGFELAGAPLTDQLWEHTLQPRTKGFERVSFPVQLGQAELRDDGTLGFYKLDGPDGGYDKFYAVQPNAVLSDAGYIASERFLRAPINGSREIALIVDPRGSVHARSGILPTKAITLPARYVDPALAAMDVTFRVGPILNEPRGMRMPLPADIRGRWSWIAREWARESGLSVGPEEEITPDDQQARITDAALRLREGWLKLSEALGEEGDR